MSDCPPHKVVYDYPSGRPHCTKCFQHIFETQEAVVDDLIEAVQDSAHIGSLDVDWEKFRAKANDILQQFGEKAIRP